MHFSRIVAIAVLLPLAAPVHAQSDEAFEAEERRLMGKIGSRVNDTDNYLGRPVAGSLELEIQMDHIDKVMEQEDIARYNAVQEERGRLAAARSDAEWQARLDKYYASANASHDATKGYIAEQNQQLAESMARYDEDMRRQREAYDAENRARYEAGIAATDALFERTRTSNQPPVNPGPTIPIEPRSGPSVPGPYFPPLQPAPASQQTPAEAYEAGARAGESIGRMIRGFMDRHKRKRRDEILERFAEGEITAEDYRQLVKDGYTDLADQLMRLEQGLD